MFESLLNHAANGSIPTSLVAKLMFLLVMTQLTILSVTLYLHRSQSHRSVDFHPALAHAFRFWCWLTTAMVTQEWVAIHRKHHAHCETELDPHSPQMFGIGKLVWGGTELYMAARADPDALVRFGHGTPQDWIERNVYTPHCNWGPTLLLILEIGLFGVAGVAIWAMQMMWIPFWGAGIVNGVGHWRGYRNFETADRSTNLSPIAIWIGGEELHNNHHAFPSSAKFSIRRYEVDLGWVAIQVLAKLGLARIKRVASEDAVPSKWGKLFGRGTRHAVLTERVKLMTGFFRNVMRPAVRDASSRKQTKLPLRLRRALADGGYWLDDADRIRLNAWIDSQPALRTLCDFRARLALLMDQRDVDIGADGLAQWVQAAMASDIGSLRAFAVVLTQDGIAKR